MLKFLMHDDSASLVDQKIRGAIGKCQCLEKESLCSINELFHWSTFYYKINWQNKDKNLNYLLIIRYRSNVENCYYEYCKTFLANIQRVFVSSNKYKRHIDFREVVLLIEISWQWARSLYGRLSFIWNLDASLVASLPNGVLNFL